MVTPNNAPAMSCYMAMYHIIRNAIKQSGYDVDSPEAISTITASLNKNITLKAGVKEN